jgi:hypothetical protein
VRRVARTGTNLVQASLRRFGYEVRRVSAPAGAAWPNPFIWIRETQNIRTIVDIGANVGDFSAFVSRFLGASATYAFEPLESCQAALAARADSIPNFHAHRLALAEGQPLFEEVHALLADLGFKDQVTVRKTGQPLFAHCLYVRRESRKP